MQLNAPSDDEIHGRPLAFSPDRICEAASQMTVRTLSLGGVLLISAVLVLPYLISDGHAQPSMTYQPSSIESRCQKEMDEKGWAMVEYRNCVFKLQQEEAKNVKAPACNDKLCVYRLDSISDTEYRGHGYVVSLLDQTQEQRTLGLFNSLVVSPDGKQTILEHGCGASSCSDPVTVKGAIRGATYKGPYFQGAKSYIVLQVPIAQPRAGNVPSSANVSSCDKADKLVCFLEGKTVDYRYDVSIEGSPALVPSFVERLKVSNNGDIYFFQGDFSRDALTDSGFIYKLNQEIDFAVNRLRAPTATSWVGVRFMKGTMFVQGDTLVRKYVVAGSKDGLEWRQSWETRIRFSQDFRTCSVVAVLWAIGTDTRRLKKSVECSVN